MANKALDYCEWTPEDPTDGTVWESGCGDMFQFTDGSPIKNDFEYCPYCGNLIVEVRDVDDGDEDSDDIESSDDKIEMQIENPDEGCNSEAPG